MSRSDVQFYGVEALEKRLKTLSDKVARKEAVKILKKGAPPIKREMKRLAPKKSGALRDSIVTRRGKKRRDLGETVLIGPKGGRGKKAAPHAHLVELGTRGGTYTAKSGSFTVFKSGGGVVRTKSITRRGSKAVKYIQRTFSSKSQAAQDKIFNAVKKLVEA